MAAGLLQVFDFWDASHEAAQQADDLGERDASAYWHGIAHRREPDPGNAAYWFRRVGRHPVSAAAGPGRPAPARSAQRPRPALPLALRRLESAGHDRPVSQATPGSPREDLARRLQRLEMWLLLEATFETLAASSRVD